MGGFKTTGLYKKGFLIKHDGPNPLVTNGLIARRIGYLRVNKG